MDSTSTNAVSTLPKLWNKGFLALLVTQFLVALNDNVFRWLIIPIGKCAVGWSESPDMVRMMGALAFLLPFLLMTAYAGYCTDRFNRRNVIIGCKIAELLILVLGTVAILMQSVYFMLFILFLLGAQSAFFSPAKYSSLPSVVPQERLSEANGYYSMATMFACVGGQLIGGGLFVVTTLSPKAPVLGSGGMDSWWIWCAVFLGIAVLGLISSFFVPSMKPANPTVPFPLNPISRTWSDLRFLFKYRFLFWTAMGSAFFWGLGAMGQSNIDKYATEMLHLRQDFAMILLVILTFGLATGAVLSGRLSRGGINYGLVPVGAFFIIVFGVFLALTPKVAPFTDNNIWNELSGAFYYGAIGLSLLGVASGLYDIPLLTTLQTDSPEEHRGRILAAYNFYSFAAMALFSFCQGAIADPKSLGIPGVSGLQATGIWLVSALVTIPVFIVATRYLLAPLLRELVIIYFRLVYNPRIIDPDNVPESGGVLLVSNHYSYIDTLLIYCYCRRKVRFIAHKDYITSPVFAWAAKLINTIAFEPGDRRSVVEMIRTSRKALANGEVVCIFPEGGITRTGQVNPFQEGFLSLLKGNENVPVVPVWLGGLFGSVFAYARPTTSGKLPSGLIQRVTVAFGKPIYQPKYAQHVQHRVEELGVEAMDPYRFPKDKHVMVPARAFIRNSRRYPRQMRLADSTGVKLNGRQTLLRALVFRRIIRSLIGKDEKIVGLLFPTSVGGVLANAAIGLDCRVPVNLNFTFSNETINYCIKQIGIKHILTTKKLLQKLPNLKVDAELIVLEDVLKTLPKSAKLLGLLDWLTPTWLLERRLGLTKLGMHDLNTIVLTSGSTGLPKGAMLTHANVASNMLGFFEVFRPTLKDMLLATLPLFHSYGYSTTAWFPLIQEASCVYHFSPLDSKTIGDLSAKFKPTIFASTPTFMRNYYRRCPKECFEHLDVAMAGAEKLPADLVERWREKYGGQLCEGFGVTELAPVLGANVPDCRRPDTYFPYYKQGSVGRICPGFVVRIVDLETGEELPPNEQGMLEVKGHSVTLGYYNDPEKTAKAFHDGWYVTGDIARLDEEGFLFITGRETRMSKIGGEMVPH
ncbi:MAG: MFS transporter, partial [Thermoguttaceae bacterium]|nr:MFS transporter [Thermoguttaceae bacterium]